jgi:predicted HTH transcriptional regulator
MMLPENLMKLIRQGEGLTVEFKKSTTDVTKDVYDTVCSFSNRDGGHIFFGVKDNGTILGVDKDCVEQMKKNFVTTINNESKMYPPIAKVFREIGLADELGSGMRNSYKYTKMYSGGEPVFTEADVFTTVIPLSEAATATVGPTIQGTLQVAPQDSHQVAPQDLEQRLLGLIDFCSTPRSKREMMDSIGLTDTKNFRERYLVPLLEAGKIEMTIPDKPNSRNQRYRKK